MTKKSHLRSIILTLMLSSNMAFSDPLNTIVLEGNKRVESETILSYISIKKGDEFSDEACDIALKSLYATGYFKDIKVNRVGQKMVVKVEENPIINRVIFEGNNKIKDDVFEEEIKIKQREVLSPFKIQEAQQRMLEIYRRFGRYNATVHPKIINLPNGRVELVFEINEGDVTNIRKIVFLGNKSFSQAALEEVLKTKVARWYRFWASDDVYDPDRFTADQQELRKYYYDRGFPDMRIVSSQAELTPDKQDFFITFSIEEGEKYTFSKPDVTCSIPKVDNDDLRKMLIVIEDHPFSGSVIEASVTRLTNYLSSKGYAFVAIEPIIKKDPKTKKAKVTFEIKEGPKVFVEKIIIKGNDRTRDYVLRREITVHEGDSYSSDKVKHSENQLKDLGYFKKVEVQAEPGSADDQAFIVATVEEQPTAEIQVSGGFSTLDGPLAQIRLGEKNFMGTGRYISTEIGVAKRRQDFSATLVEPYLLDYNMSGTFSVFSTRSTRFQTFTQKRTGISAGIMYALSPFWSQSWNYNISFEDIKNTVKNDNISPYLLDQKGQNVLSSLSHTIAYDVRNNSSKPSAGHRIALTTTYAGLGGSIQYLQNSLSGSYYKALSNDVTLILKGEVGGLMKVQKKIRAADRFFLGANSFRGFEYGEMGPRDAVNKEALGGTRFWTATAEITFPLGLPNEFGVSGAVFTDIGSLWKVGDSRTYVPDPAMPNRRIKRDIMNDKHYTRVSVGAGISWDSPFAPISIDYSKAIKRKKHDNEQKFLFGFSTRY